MTATIYLNTNNGIIQNSVYTSNALPSNTLTVIQNSGELELPEHVSNVTSIPTFTRTTDALLVLDTSTDKYVWKNLVANTLGTVDGGNY